MSSDRPAIRAAGLRKSYGATTALAGLDLEVPEGTVRAVLGPNGAGKTTAVRILTTLLKPDGGTAEVLGLDVVRDAQKLRASVGLTGQYAAVDEMMTGLENLEMFGRLYHLKPSTARARGAELLERFDLVDAADRLAKTYSGGMRRRLDLAASLIMAPKMLFLDEPTTGLDPRSRMAMWGVIEELVGDGTTVLLTTQYLEEADQLSDLITVIDSGRVIAEGTSDELKTQVGGQRLAVTIGRGGDLETAATALARFGKPEVTAETRMIVVPVDVDAGVLPDVIRELDAASVPVADIALHRPTLDDVFLTLTGRRAEGDEDAPADETAPELVESR